MNPRAAPLIACVVSSLSPPFGRVTHETMAAVWRRPASGRRPEWMPEWMEPVGRTVDAARKFVVSSASTQVDWNAELVRGDIGTVVRHLKEENGRGLARRSSRGSRAAST